jgi:LPXTG-site transpeptidase (sortase) family protein
MPETSLKKSKAIFGLALLFLGVIFVFGRPDKGVQELTNSSYTFAEEPVKVEGFKNEEKEGVPTRVIIPQLSIDLDVQKAKIVNGYWEVFPDKAAWGLGSGLPGKDDNQVIFAHAREGLFLPLKEIEVGMSVYVTTKDSWYSYQVDEIKEVTPDQVEIIKPTEEEILTLYTCSGFNDQKRLIVIAKPQ